MGPKSDPLATSSANGGQQLDTKQDQLTAHTAMGGQRLGPKPDPLASHTAMGGQQLGPKSDPPNFVNSGTGTLVANTVDMGFGKNKHITSSWEGFKTGSCASITEMTVTVGSEFLGI